MLWYGTKYFNKISQNSKKVYKRQNKNFNTFVKTLAFPVLRHGSLFGSKFNLYIPTGWNLIILKSKNDDKSNLLVYVYSDIYYFKFAILKSFLLWDYNPYSHHLLISNNYVSSFYRTYFTKITNIFYSFSKLFFTKLKFKGKGYYIYKTYRNTITHQFGHSHRWYIHAFFVSVKFLNKTTVFLFGSSKKDVFFIGHSIKSSKFINIFTGRGVRFVKQILYKKTGKVSSYR